MRELEASRKDQYARSEERIGITKEVWYGSAGAYDIWAKRTPCTTARWLGRRWNERAWDEGFPRQVGRFRCRALEPHPNSGKIYIGKVFCTSNGGRQAVRFGSTI